MTDSQIKRFSLFVFFLFFAVMVVFSALAQTFGSTTLTNLSTMVSHGFQRSLFSALLFSPSPLLRAGGIFLNNLKVLAVVLAAAGLLRVKNRGARFVGYIGLALFVGLLIVNAVVGGLVVTAIARAHHAAWPLVMLAGILPHGVFEIGAYAFGIGLAVAASRPAGVRSRVLYHTLLPIGLLLLAALVESFVTPLLLGLVT
ncbi:MAG: stage II sporulation protein M [Sulfobacillus sp.]